MKKSALFFCSIFLLACDGNDVPDSSLNSYLPLQVGNSWKFVSISGDAGGAYSFKRVTSKATIDGHDYYEIVSGNAAPQEVAEDTTYYRIDNENFVYVRGKHETNESNLYRLEGADGDSWSFEVANFTVSMDLAVVSVTIGEKELKNCKAFSYDAETIFDEEYTTTLAEGIGFVRIYSNAWGNGRILKSAVINGHNYNF